MESIIERMTEQQLEARLHQIERMTEPTPEQCKEYDAIEAELSDRMDNYFFATDPSVRQGSACLSEAPAF